MNDKISKIEKAGIAKRLWSAIMDAALFVFTFIALSLWVMTPIANAAFNYGGQYELGSRYHLASHLYLFEKKDDNGNKVIVPVKESTGNISDYNEVTLYSYNGDYEIYVRNIYYYYHNYKTNTEIELPNNTESKTWDVIEDHFVSPEYNKKINGVLPVNLYTNEWFSENILKIGSEDSFFKIDSSKTDYVESIVLIDETKKSEAISFLKNQAYEATRDFYYSDYFNNINKTIEALQIFIFVPSFVISFSIYYFLIPMLMKDGETLGKKINHLAVVSFDGYKVKYRQLVLRQIILFIGISLSAVIIGIGLTSIATTCVGVLILFVATLISKNKRSPHDFAAYTIVVDAIRSTWFKNKDDEEKHLREIEENMAKYKKDFSDNKNLIQVNGVILDEDLKKEIEKQSSDIEESKIN